MSLTSEEKILASVENTGFISNENAYTGRYINGNGSLNVDILGIPKLRKFSIYHSLLALPLWKFLIMIVIFYSVINFLFAIIYVSMGIQHLHGVIARGFFENFVEAYFFSSQTLTTVGYGRVSPLGMWANVVASFEALIGIMTLALITGLLYGRFTRPKAYISYSKIAVIAPFRDGTGLMFRMAPRKVNTVSDLNASVTMSMQVETDGVVKNTFFTLPLQLKQIMSLASSWTLVHPIDKDSPLYNLSQQEIENRKVHILVFIRGFDEGFSNTVVSRTEYLWKDIVSGAKFTPMYHMDADDNRMKIDLRKLDAHVRI